MPTFLMSLVWKIFIRDLRLVVTRTITRQWSAPKENRRGPAPEAVLVLKESAALPWVPVSGAKEQSKNPWSALLNVPMLAHGTHSGNGSLLARQRGPPTFSEIAHTVS